MANKNKLLSMFDDLLNDYAGAAKKAEKLIELKESEEAIRGFVEDIVNQLVEAHNELPRTDPKAWTLELSTAMELNLTIKADLCKGHPGSYWEPPEPASIEDMEILIEGCGITQQLFNKLTERYERELDEQVWDEAEAMEQDYLEQQAEHRMAAAEARRDLEEGR